MSDTPVLLPDGTPFAFWDDQTNYRRVYHVAAGHPRASDDGPGTEAAIPNVDAPGFALIARRELKLGASATKPTFVG